MQVIAVPNEKVPLMIQKSDGGFGYGTTDMATLKQRIQVLHQQVQPSAHERLTGHCAGLSRTAAGRAVQPPALWQAIARHACTHMSCAALNGPERSGGCEPTVAPLWPEVRGTHAGGESRVDHLCHG